MAFKCPFCSQEGPPMVTKKMSTGGWVLFAVLVFFCVPLCWLPFVIDGWKEEVRTCSGCGSKLG